MKNKEIIEKVIESFEDKKGWSEIVSGALRQEYMLKIDVEYALEKALALKDKEIKEIEEEFENRLFTPNNISKGYLELENTRIIFKQIFAKHSQQTKPSIKDNIFKTGNRMLVKKSEIKDKTADNSSDVSENIVKSDGDIFTFEGKTYKKKDNKCFEVLPTKEQRIAMNELNEYLGGNGFKLSEHMILTHKGSSVDRCYLEEDVKKLIQIISNWVKEHIEEKKMINPENMLHVIECGVGDLK